MDEPEFNDLPLSYRWSQRGMLAAVSTLTFSWSLAAPQWPVFAKWGLAGVVACVVGFALLTSCYVVIRYPYLSLIRTRDADVYSEQFTSRALARVTKALSLVVLFVLLVVLVYATWTKGIVNLLQVLSLAYVTILFFFVVYLHFFYDAELHPTVATFIRSTLGIGIILIPLFLPILLVGSARCRRLLDAALSDQQSGLTTANHAAHRSTT